MLVKFRTLILTWINKLYLFATNVALFNFLTSGSTANVLTSYSCLSSRAFFDKRISQEVSGDALGDVHLFSLSILYDLILPMLHLFIH